jgi:DNA-binding response OmpR family regulator
MGKIRILAVDDNAVNLAMLEQELQGKYKVIAVNSGSRAVKYVYREPVDLVLLDVQMPIMDGIETLREIRSQKNGSDVPVIFLTSSNDRATVMEGIKLGIVDYIVKPFQSQDLHERVERALKQRGVLPLEGSDLYRSLRELAAEIRKGSATQAAAKAADILSYKLDEEVSGRLGVVKAKLDAGETTAARDMVDRILQMLKKKEGEANVQEIRPINNIELTVRLRYALTALENFQIKEATEKLNNLMQYEMPMDCYNACKQSLKCLQNYDDMEAEKLLRTALDRARGV